MTQPNIDTGRRSRSRLRLVVVAITFVLVVCFATALVAVSWFLSTGEVPGYVPGLWLRLMFLGLALGGSIFFAVTWLIRSLRRRRSRR